jgi:parvulin-like peptidyl-prolyl isomerase
MSTAVSIVMAVIGVAGVGAAVVLYLKRALNNAVALAERDEALRMASEQVAAQQRARAAERAARAAEFNDKKDAVRTASDAAALLRGELAGTGGTEATDQVPGEGVDPSTRFTN